MRICETKDCPKKHYSKGLCKSHYYAIWNKLNSDKVKKSHDLSRAKHAADRNAYNREWNRVNKLRKAENDHKWKLANPEKIRSYCSKWSKANSGACSAKTAKRRAQKLKATPPWADLAEIEKIYLSRPPGHDVDHIVPLINPNVCGLHVAYNLQYLPESENRRKSNKWQL